MKTKRIPKFKSEKDEAEFWATHSIADYLPELKVVHNVKFIRAPKRLISLRMDDAQIQSLKAIAHTKKIGYLTLIRLWVAERISKESKNFHPA